MWMGTQRVQMKEDLPCLIRWACRASTRYFLFCLGCSSRLVGQYKILFFPQYGHYSISIPLSPSPSKLDMQLWWVATLLVCVSGPIPHVLLPLILANLSFSTLSKKPPSPIHPCPMPLLSHIPPTPLTPPPAPSCWKRVSLLRNLRHVLTDWSVRNLPHIKSIKSIAF
jgi:hypothetical protein